MGAEASKYKIHDTVAPFKISIAPPAQTYFFDDEKCSQKQNQFPAFSHTFPKQHQQIKHLHVPQAKAFLIRNFLSPEECQYYVSQTENVQYTTIETEYPKEYRNSERVLIRSPEITESLYKRLALVAENEFVAQKPFGFGSEGVWKPYGFNEVLRFNKYLPGGKFLPHYDNTFVKSDSQRSIFTVIIYLNSDFSGGKTRFFKRQDNLPFLDAIKDENVIDSVQPETGTCLVFNHDVLHDGEQVLFGTKYIIRGEIMFERVSKSASILNQYSLFSKEFLESNVLYMTSEDQERRGLLNTSTKTYLKALSMQANYSPSVATQNNSFEAKLPFDMLLHILQYIDSPSDLVRASEVCRRWNIAALDDNLWKLLYTLANNSSETPISSNHWYANFKDKKIGNKGAGVPVHIFGASTFYSGIGGTLQPYICDEAIYYTSLYGHGFLMRNFLIGQAAKTSGSYTRALSRIISEKFFDFNEAAKALQKTYTKTIKDTAIFVLNCAPARNKFAKHVDFAKIVHGTTAVMIGSGMENGVLIYSGAKFTFIQAIYKKRAVGQIRLDTAGISLNTDVLKVNEAQNTYPYECKAIKAQYFKVASKDAPKLDEQAPIKFHDTTFTIKDMYEATEKHITTVIASIQAMFAANSPLPCEYESLLEHVVLAGGNTMMTGYAERMQQELMALYPKLMPQVFAHPERDRFKWLGASKIASNLPRYSDYIYSLDDFAKLHQ